MTLNHPSSRHYARHLQCQDLLAEAERARLAAQARPGGAVRPPIAAARHRVGAWLIDLGRRLGGREPVAGVRRQAVGEA